MCSLDREETLGGGSGWNECAEKLIADLFESKGYTVLRNYAPAYNRVDYNSWYAIGLHAVTIRISLDEYCKYFEGTFDSGLYHVYLNNGNLTYIHIPG